MSKKMRRIIPIILITVIILSVPVLASIKNNKAKTRDALNIERMERIKDKVNKEYGTELRMASPEEMNLSEEEMIRRREETVGSMTDKEYEEYLIEEIKSTENNNNQTIEEVDIIEKIKVDD